MKVGIIISTSDPETVFNALRLGNFAIGERDQVQVFLLGRGVELDTIDDKQYNIIEQVEIFLEKGGTILTCGTCLKMRKKENPEVCSLSTMKELYLLIQDADRVITF